MHKTENETYPYSSSFYKPMRTFQQLIHQTTRG